MKNAMLGTVNISESNNVFNIGSLSARRSQLIFNCLRKKKRRAGLVLFESNDPQASTDMYMYRYIYGTYINTHTHTYCTPIYTVHTCIHTCIHTHTHTYIYTYVYLHIPTYSTRINNTMQAYCSGG